MTADAAARGRAAATTIKHPTELHLHGVSAEDIAAAIRQAQREAGD